MNARHFALFALTTFEIKGNFLADILDYAPIDPKERSLAYELSHGTMRMQRLLDALLKQLITSKKLPSSVKKRWILRMTLYSLLFLTKTPSYASLNEMVELAKKEVDATFAKFVNAIGRALVRVQTPPFPEALAERYSYSDDFVDMLQKRYSQEQVLQILDAQNSAPPLFAYLRTERKSVPCTDREAFAKDPSYYIQNATQTKLYLDLLQHIEPPQRALDLCCSPGGKLLLIHDMFPQAELYANDISEKKLARIRENLEKFGFSAHLSCSRGEAFTSPQTFDLIVIDAPCSNSGVLYKCPEARFRLTYQTVRQLQEQSLKLIEHMIPFLSPRGSILFSTCSILHEENEATVEAITSKYGLSSISQLQLPSEIHEGGFASLLKK